MNKRRRTSSVASRGQDEDNESDTPTPEPAKKRKKLDPVRNQVPSEICHQLYDAIRNHKKEDGSLLCDAFIRVPKRRQEPGYYEVVTNPIDLLKIQQKLKTDEYEDVEEITTDVQLMVNNAKAFYKRTSQEHRDACELWDLFSTTKVRLLDTADEEPKGKIILKVGKLARRAAAAEARRQDVDMAEDTSESSTNAEDDIANQLEDLFTAVMMATDGDNRPLNTVFQLLPSKKRYPEYYEVIDGPVDLKLIATKIQQNKYALLAEMEKDLLQMTRNACLFNEPGSQIYKDAKALKKIISSKKIEVEHGKFVSGKSSERISVRNKRMRGVQSLSAITAALQDEEEDEDEGDEGETDAEDSDNPRWQLYELIKMATNNQGHLLSEPFWKLPARRHYPDYYKEIRNPLSLFQIRNKLRRGDYGTVSEVAGDLNIMFENAKKYNRQDSRLYKDAVKLQKMMQTKVQELLDFEQDSDSEDDSDEKGGRRKRARGSTPKAQTPLKKRLIALCKSLLEYMREDGRQPILMFMEKPSKKLYPDYFQVIAEPIDVLTIEANIKNDKYSSEEEMIADFKLMFNNCRQYNEEGSMIYDDANTLEEFMMNKVQELATSQESAKKTVKRSVNREIYSSPRPKKSPALTALNQKLKTIYDTIRDYKDPKGRQLSLIFLKLPSKSEYPDYYEVIKRPIDLERISQKLKAGQYESIDDMVGDIVLMFDNACKYNEPDSQIYKDALMLQRVALQTKLQLRENEEAVPDVTLGVQEVITSLFISVYNHQDEEGRCFSDSMAELPEHDELPQGNKVRALSLDLIKRRLDRNMYRRLDMFQEDFFACLERARKLSRTDSQVFEDSIELQSFFIRTRDDLCRGGDLLHSPALSYTLLHLAADVEATRQEKLMREQPDEDTETRSSEDSMPIKQEPNASGGDTLSYNQHVYCVGDFVYVDAKERGMDLSIVMVERLWTNNEGQQMMYGNYFFRPSETYHVTTRKFLEKELFKSDQHIAIPLDQVKGTCCVLFVKDYFRLRPEAFNEKDVYVCESRYSTRARAFKKIKVWPGSEKGLVPRDEPLELRRVMSVFRERVEKHKEEIAELEEREKFIHKEKPNVEVLNPHGMDGCTYYEQYVTECGPVRTGDCVFVRTDSGRKLIAQVDSIWTNKQGVCYFQGPWLVTAPEIPQAPNRLFYKQEVFLSTLDDTNLITSIVGKCAVLEQGEYISCRPTEIPESDVFICESIYDEARRQVRPLPREGLRKYSHSHAVYEDEIYFFRRLINPPKIGSESAQNQGESAAMAPPQYDLLQEAVAMIPRGLLEQDCMTEDSLDGGPPSVGSGDMPTPTTVSTPITSKKVLGLLKKNKKDGKKIVTGYILYSSDVRRSISASNPDSNFGEISRIVGNEWRNLPAHDKQMWEERAVKVNEETTAKFAELGMAGGSEACSSPAPPPVNPHPVEQGGANGKIFECLWDNCDWQFEDLTDCIDHCIQEPNGHVHMHFAAIPPQDAEFQCHWRGCSRIKKSAPPFPNVQRLARHVKEVHIQKSSGRVILPADRSKNFVVSRKPVLPPIKTTNFPNTPYNSVGMAMSRQTPSPLSHNGGTGLSVRQHEPLFVAVPPRPQRLLHSDAYIKYIEGLNVDNKYISSWDKQLRATHENTPVPDASRLPEAWLGNGVANHGNVVNALWTLRDFMMRDAFGINKVIKINE